MLDSPALAHSQPSISLVYGQPTFAGDAPIHFMGPIERALRYPTASTHWPRNIALGGVLTFLSFLVIPLIFVYGYGIAVIRTV